MRSSTCSVINTQSAVLAAILLGFPSAVLAQPDPSSPEMLKDAELTAVTFVDADRGWAVGDRGVIWHTIDGGHTWKLQVSGVTCRLEAIQFLDGDNGFAVGGWTQPYTHESRGVALRTRDGGRTWLNTPDLTLPGLRHVRFFDPRTGWALGDSSPLYPSGVFRSEDGGRTWAPVPKGNTCGWATGDFRDNKTGALASLDGATAIVTPNETRPSRTPNLSPRYLQRLIVSGGAAGWLVGDGGLVLTTIDGGFTWTAPAGQLPDFVSRELDFRALAIKGNHVWMAGAPGTTIVHSPDNGRTWQTHRTDQTAPLRGLWFLDEHRGWAVGSLGLILHTRDGGRSWRVQRSGGTRAALLAIFSEPTRVPLDLVASQAGNEGFLAAVEIIGRSDHAAAVSRAIEKTFPQRTQAAVVAAGGSMADVAWRFPLDDSRLLSSSDAVVARWNAANDGQGLQRLEEHLVRRIRQWRPEVIVTEEVSARGENPLAHITNQIALAAVAKAADGAAFSNQIAAGGLAPWQVKKVLTVLSADKQGMVNLTPSQLGSRLGRSFAEQAEAGRGLLFSDVASAPRNLGLTVLVDRLPQDSGKRDVMSGIVLAAGGEARRQLSDPPATNLDALSRAAQKRHNVAQLLDRIESDPTVGSGWLGSVGDLTKDVSPRAAGEILWQLGRKYQQVGKTSLAAEAFHLLVEKHPQHPLADAAALWLVQYYASGEIAWRERKQTKFEVSVATATNPHERSGDAPNGTKQKRDADVRQVSFASMGGARTAAPDLNPTERAGRAIALAKQVEQTRPTIYAEPALRFALAAAARKAGQPRAADRFFQNLAASSSESIWSQNAAAEHWLFHPNENPPKKICSVVTALQKPKLDGRLDDPLWQIGKPVALKSDNNDNATPPAAAVLAFDDEYLYVAISCGKAPGVDYTAKETTRTADDDLSSRDRVMILLDVDRDYASFWNLTIDHRGWPAESCFGDATWNPQWFVAASGDEQFWTAEAAIPLVELTAKKPQVRDVWTIGIQRIIPRVGLQSFSKPAAVEPRPEGFGLMVFE